MNIREIMTLAPVIPVLSIENEQQAVPLAQALVAGGLKSLEITLRTPAALAAIQAIAADVKDAVVGVGTVTRPEDLHQAVAAGARFAVSPGLTTALIEAAHAYEIPFLPGVMTPSELLYARAAGFSALKLFPAQAAGDWDTITELARKACAWQR